MISKRHDTDMTQGNILKLLISFAVPLFIGNFFQQLYNTVDSIVVGNYVSKQALAAVGTTTPIINTLIGFFMGMSAGAGVVISQYYGARQDKKVHDAVHTTVMLITIMGILFTVIGIFGVPYMLDLMKTPEDVFEEAATYLRIYFSGIFGLMIYNMGSGILRAVGDFRRPFIFLIISAILNVILDLLFVLAFNMGVAGVAYATVISQLVSAVLVVIVLLRVDSSYKIILRDIRIKRDMLKQIVGIGFPSALQMAITSFSNVFVQSYINNFGSDCMAGWSSYSKLDQFVLLPMQSMALGLTSFVGQNLGARNTYRVKKGVRIAILASVISTAILIIPVMLFAEPLVSLFNAEVPVIAFGATFLRLLSPFYVLCCLNQVLGGALRGAGDTTAPMIIMLFSFVFFRQIYLFIISVTLKSVTWIALGYPAGWILCSTLCIIYYKTGKWEKHSILSK